MCLVTLLVLVAVGATVAGQMSGSLIFRKAVPQKLCCKSKRLKAWRQNCLMYIAKKLAILLLS